MTITEKAALFLYRHGEFVACLGLLMALLLMSLMGCSSVPPCEPEVVTVPQPVEVPVLVKGDPLPICEPELEACHQETDLEVVRCIGRNVQALIVCHQENTDTIAAHNHSIE